MQFHTHQAELRQRRYPFLSIFDVTLNVMLSGAILAVGCVLLSVILSHNAPLLIAQVSDVTTRIFS